MSQGNYAPANRLLLARSRLVELGCWAFAQEEGDWLDVQMAGQCIAAYACQQPSFAFAAAVALQKSEIASFGFAPFALLLDAELLDQTFPAALNLRVRY